MVAAFFCRETCCSCVHQGLTTHTTGQRLLFLRKTRPRRPHERARHPAHGPIFFSFFFSFLRGVDPARGTRLNFLVSEFKATTLRFGVTNKSSASGARGNEWAGKRAKLLLISGARRSSLSALRGHIRGARVTPAAPISLRRQKSTFVSAEVYSFTSRLAREYQRLYVKLHISLLLFLVHAFIRRHV